MNERVNMFISPFTFASAINTVVSPLCSLFFYDVKIR